MPIEGVRQPDILEIDEMLRLRRFDGHFAFALPWYQDEETVWLVDGVRRPYDRAQLERMYGYLDRRGELYFIELSDGQGDWRPVGDVTFWQEDMPIVIGDHSCRGKGIGGKVVGRLVERGRELGYDCLCVQEIYRHNPASKRCFEKAGFQVYEQTEKGERFRLLLEGA